MLLSGIGGGVESSWSTSSLAGTAARRRRSLAFLAPVFENHLRRAQNPSTIAWSRYDFIALIQLCVDTVALASGLEGSLGAPRTVVLSEMTCAASAMAPDRPAAEHTRVARHVLDRLLRHDERTPYFSVAYADPSAEWRSVTATVRFAFETLAEDGHTLLVNVDKAAVALLLIATDRSPEDEHEAVIAVLRAQVDSGRLDAAIDSAQDALTLSRTYAAAVRRLIDEAERDVTHVSYLTILQPELTRAAHHLDRRLNVDGALRRHLEQLRSNASQGSDAHAVDQLSAALARLDEAVETLTALNTEVIEAAPRWRAAQAAQALSFAPTRNVDPTADLLTALLKGEALPHLPALTPPMPQAVLDITALGDRLSRPPEQPVDVPALPGPAEALTEEAVFEQFPPLFHRAADALREFRIAPGNQVRVTDLLSDVESLFAKPDLSTVVDLAALAGGDADTARLRLRLLIALDALLLWRPDNQPAGDEHWWAIDDGALGDLPDLHLPDLLICHREVQP
ncbi:hypothetical protein BIV57_05185 [Mangrovactinospora gilvigrisea]|uniref:Uncharacterized protein n=1 Tax=Mangrovactinospora gilvigrisea TaxID=1428644 RepID=A0A1J7BYI0_9ACTN|nr:hypothetical protein [Mangrovactinospora gilvigrisea]OIV38529.1 hypothetical protein BIV57_05185 [Mangrovactinospora gilvigrisea]